MSKNKSFILVSLGQISNSNIQNSIDEFAQIIAEKSPFLRFLGKGSGRKIAQFFVNGTLFLDSIYSIFGRDSIEKYRRGEVNFAQFRTIINKKLGVQIEENKFKAAWNKMCKVDDKTFEDVKDLLKRNPQSIICIFARTNQEHLNCIKNQFNQKGLDIDKHPNIKIATSFDNKTSDEKELVKKLLTEAGYSEGNNLISLHNRFKNPEDCGCSKENFEYIAYDSKIPGASLSGSVQKSQSKNTNLKVIEEVQISEELRTLHQDALQKQNKDKNIALGKI